MEGGVVQTTRGESGRNVRSYAAAVAAVILWLLHFLPFFIPDGRLWGFNHLLFLPAAYTIIYAVAGLICLLAFLPPIAHRIQNWFESCGGFLFDESPYLRWAITGVILLPIFWLLRMPTNLLGDGYTVINNIAGDMPVIFKWSEVGAVKVIYWVSRIIPVEGLARGEYAFALVSVLSGAITVFFFFGIASEFSRDNITRIFILCLLIFSGWSLMFFGYAENYPILWPFITGYIYFAVRYLQGKGWLIVPLLFLIAALILHLQAVFILASVVVVFLGRGGGHRYYKRHAKLAWAVFAGVAVVAAAAFIWKYNQSLPFRIHFLPPFVGRTATPNSAIFSPTHLLDMANELLLVAPLLPVLIILGWKGRRSLVANPPGVFLLVFAGGGLLLLFMLDPRLGMGRDWDLFALSGLGLSLAALWSVSAADGGDKRFYPVLAVLAVVLIFPFFATNLSEKPSIAYMKWLLNLDAAKSKSGMVMLRDYYTAQGNKTAADSINVEIGRRHPSARLGFTAINLLNAGRYQEALAVADTMYALDPESKESFNIRGNAYLRMGQYNRAMKDLMTSLELGPYDYRTMVRVAEIYYRENRYDSAMHYLRRAQKYGPREPSVIESLAIAFLGQRRIDSAFVYGKELIQVDSTSPTGYFITGAYYYLRGDSARARVNLTRYVQMRQPGPNRDRAIGMLRALDSLSQNK